MKRQRKTAVFFMAGAAAGWAGIAYAGATAAASSETPGAVVAGLVFNGLMSLGSTGYIVKRALGKLDAHEASIPKIVEALETHKETLGEIRTSLRELYGSRNAHESALTGLRKQHDMLDCLARFDEITEMIREGGKRS